VRLETIPCLRRGGFWQKVPDPYGHKRMNAPRTLLALSSLVAASAIACSAPNDRPARERASEHLGQVSSPVIAGKDSDKSQDAVVLIIHYDPAKRDFGSCTGTLLNSRLVLTARHCVADTDEYAACDVKGEPIAAGEIRGNHKAETLYIFTGTQRPDFRTGDVEPDGQGLQILDDGGKNLCNHDIALIVLKDPIKDAKIQQIRLDGPIRKGEILTAVGWGVTDVDPQPEIRQQRTGIKVEEIGPNDESILTVPPNEFAVGESICSGDSGGPALASTTKAIVGIVSRGGNATKPDPNNPASTCINGENLYTKVEPFKDLILRGFELIEADPWYENGADPRLARPGAICTDGAECRSNLCLLDPESKTAETKCAADCSTTECPAGQNCVAEGDAQVCRNPVPVVNNAKTTTEGCAAAPIHSDGSSDGGARAIGFVLAALGLVALRRRRNT
jgi:MYXO-CTERM domain-containing protein